MLSWLLRPYTFASALLALLPTVTLAQQLPTWEWVSAVKTSRDIRSKAVKVDATGNTYVLGEFSAQARFGSTELTSKGWYDMFVAKYDPSGRLLWVRQAGTVVENPRPDNSWTDADGLALDTQGNVYVTGTCKGRTQFDAAATSSPSTGAVYVAKYASTGTLRWVRTYGRGGGMGIATDGTNAYVVALTQTTASSSDFGPTLTKLDPEGNPLWITTVRSAAGNRIMFAERLQVEVGANRAVYFSGHFDGPAVLAAEAGRVTRLASVGTTTLFLACYSLDGSLQWARTGGAPGSHNINTGLAVDAAGNAIVTGVAQGAGATFGDVTLTARGEWDTYLVKYDAHGRVRWAQQEGGPQMDAGTAVDVDQAGNIYLAGYFYAGQARYGATLLTGTATYGNLALVRYDPQGRAQWGVTQQGGGNLFPAAVAVSPAGDVYMAGDYANTVQLGPTLLEHEPRGVDQLATLVAKLTNNEPALPPDSVTPLLVPNIITPNEDARNDAFRIAGLPAGTWSLSVFNRWGNQVFHTRTYRQDWQAQGLGEGSYYYILEEKSRNQILKGWLQVVR
ncbi:gliding motility-associated C-terminal domain-containing protein [Hymenobacter sp. UYP22]|uniref:T9SS type B sorting domain-containing protein n=1 Tax=Hymenobacter sp. UYP22 TaxID=3156348 RepID=UPI003394C8E1